MASISIGFSISGSGYMDLSTQSREKIRRGSYLIQIRNSVDRVLADFAREFELSRNKRVLLVLDQAGWHISHQLEIPEGIDLFFLPSYSPELYAKRLALEWGYPLGQPAERLWPLTNEVIANRVSHTIAEVEDLLVFRCQQLLKQHDLISGLTCYHWWPITRTA